MSNPEYHEETDEKTHKDWIRVECLELALKRYPYKTFPELIAEAKTIEDYVFDRRPAQVVKLQTIGEMAEELTGKKSK